MTPEERDEWAKKNEWLILLPGEAYMKQVTDIGSIFLFEDDEPGLWTTVYQNHRVDHKGQQWGSTTVKEQAVRWAKALSAAETTDRRTKSRRTK